ncbi:MAG: 30S ribosomal protein S17 [Rhabdochlamydiaceae bacterium]|nr:30S ribosomal protein S17 [Rhabdochlamydiaceae bacterium]
MMKNEERGTRKVREGVVVSNKMNKTVTVKVDRKFRHPQFEKVVIRGKKYYAHTELDNIQVGQRVRIQETRPISKLKRWRVLEIVT